MRLQDRFFSQVPAAYKPIYSMVVETAQKEHSIPLAFAKKKSRGTPVAPTSWGTFARVFMADSESRGGPLRGSTCTCPRVPRPRQLALEPRIVQNRAILALRPTIMPRLCHSGHNSCPPLLDPNEAILRRHHCVDTLQKACTLCQFQQVETPRHKRSTHHGFHTARRVALFACMYRGVAQTN